MWWKPLLQLGSKFVDTYVLPIVFTGVEDSSVITTPFAQERKRRAMKYAIVDQKVVWVFSVTPVRCVGDTVKGLFDKVVLCCLVLFGLPGSAIIHHRDGWLSPRGIPPGPSQALQ